MKIQKSLLILLLLFAPGIYAAPYVIGDTLQAVSLDDQHKKPGHINTQTRMILFSRDKAGGELMAEALSDIPRGYLAEQHIVYITDISGMPGLISKYVAIPSMRKKPYPMLLDKDGSKTEKYPDQNDASTLIYIESLKIKNILHLSSIKEIRQALGLE